MDLRPLLFAALVLFPASCGESEVNANASLNSGVSSLNAKNYQDALADFDKALAILTPEHEDYLGAKLNQLKALAFIDPDKAKTALLEIPGTVGILPNDYRGIVGELTTSAEDQTKAGDKDAAAHSMAVAVQILEAGSKTFPDYEGWEELITVTGNKAENLGANGAVEALKGLGYTGDGDE